MGGILEKPQLINFIAKVMEESGFKVYKNFKTSQRVIDIYAILPTTLGDFGVVVACNNYDKNFEVSVDLLKEMEDVADNLKASKVAIITSSYFTEQATNYALRKNIKLVDRENLLEMAKKYQMKEETQPEIEEEVYDDEGYDDFDYIGDEYPEYSYDADDMDYLSSERQENPMLYQNSLYKQIGEDRKGNFLSRLTHRSKVTSSSLYGSNRKRDILDTLRPFLSNPIILIILIVVVIYILSYILGNLLGIDAGIVGLIQLLAALILAYGVTFYIERNRFFIIKGTVIFFVSLIILILLILF